MVLRLAVVVMLGLPAVAAAQEARPIRPAVAPLPPIGLPLPQIGLPLPPIGLPAKTATAPRPRTSASQARRGAANRPDSRSRRGRQSAPYLVPVFGWPYGYDAPAAATVFGSVPVPEATPEPQPLSGRLQLDVKPRGGQQLFVDGYYVGTPEHFEDGLELQAGAHTVEIRANGYETLQLPVSIAAGRSITYRGTMIASSGDRPVVDAAAPATAPVAPATPTTHYIVPGCYIGNVPPTDAGLPAGCDPSRVITIP